MRRAAPHRWQPPRHLALHALEDAEAFVSRLEHRGSPGRDECPIGAAIVPGTPTRFVASRACHGSRSSRLIVGRFHERDERRLDPHRRDFELAASRPLGYGRPVFRRVASFLALLALLAAPAVTSTRLFCRFTGQEFVGCVEASPQHGAEVRPDDCCDQRTFRALDGMRLAENQPQPAPATVLVTDAVTPLVIASAAMPSVRPERSVQSVGPPVFLVQRALLI